MAEHTKVDVALIGGGLSAAFTAITLLEDHPELELRLALIDPVGIGGVAYGDRSGNTGLTITDLEAFLPPDELAMFTEWVERELAELLGVAPPPAEFASVPRRWAERNRAAIEAREWPSIQAPRRWFGRYLEQRLDAALAGARSEVITVAGSVTALDHDDGGYRVVVDDGRVFDAPVAVLAVGAGQNRRLWESSTPGLINDLYHPGLDDTLRNVAGNLPASRAGRILAIGANAAAMELIYHLAYADLPEVELTVLAPSGRLPFLHPDDRPATEFVPTKLHELTGQSDDSLTATAIENAFRAGMVEGRDDGLTDSQTFGSLERLMLELVRRLPAAELERFAARSGIAIGRLQRRAGAEVSAAAEVLRREGRLDVISGRYESVRPADAGELHRVTWTADDEVVEEAFDVVVNCAGAAVHGDVGACSLTEQLLDRGVVRANPSGRGLVVDGSLEAAPGLYVIGPALAGNVINGAPTWHTEHCGRLIGFAQQLAGHLADSFGSADELLDAG